MNQRHAQRSASKACSTSSDGSGRVVNRTISAAATVAKRGWLCDES